MPWFVHTLQERPYFKKYFTGVLHWAVRDMKYKYLQMQVFLGFKCTFHFNMADLPRFLFSFDGPFKVPIGASNWLYSDEMNSKPHHCRTFLTVRALC